MFLLAEWCKGFMGAYPIHAILEPKHCGEVVLFHIKYSFNGSVYRDHIEAIKYFIKKECPIQFDMDWATKRKLYLLGVIE